ncbi:organelle RRM domain-containing protein 2, mitochondrial-like isoform X1 [Silene latifolia]|uniref:organelle RRM domain-containing protein 2, mitochondrial-like isoform X1 n=1 Tax=Silene latifolia TaxID=37657 RepID=UPI003D783A6D
MLHSLISALVTGLQPITTPTFGTKTSNSFFVLHKCSSLLLSRAFSALIWVLLMLNSFENDTGLNKRTTTDGLHEAFSKFGEVVHAKVVTDHVSGFSKGFGFVKYATTEEAKSGIEGMNGAFLDGWVIFAEFAKPRPAPAYQQQNGSPPFGKRGY